jgi:hypothetical protein
MDVLIPTENYTDTVWEIEKSEDPKLSDKVCIKTSTGAWFVYPGASAEFLISVYEDSVCEMKTTISKLISENKSLKDRLDKCSNEAKLLDENTQLKNKLTNISTNIKSVSDRVNHVISITNT